MIKFKIIILLTIAFNCNGHLRLFGDIISSTHEKIHSTVHDVAGSVLGGLTHGINLNFDSHIGINEQRRPDPGFQQHPYQNGYNPGQSVDKVIVVIKEEDKYNQRPPPPPPPDANYQQPNRPPFNHNGYRPGNNYNQEPGYDNTQGHENYNNQQLNYYPNNHQGNDYNQGSNYGPPNGNNNQHNFDRPHNIPEGNNYGNQDTHYGSINTPVPEENTTKQPKNPVEEVTTKSPNKDEPFFIPLNPNEYIYGKDKINITEPKREINNEAQKNIEDGVGNLDIRFKDD